MTHPWRAVAILIFVGLVELFGVGGPGSAESAERADVRILMKTKVPGAFDALAVSPSGSEIVVGTTGRRPPYRNAPAYLEKKYGLVSVLRASDGTILRSREFVQGVTWIAWSPDGGRIAVAFNGHWDPRGPVAGDDWQRRHVSAGVTVVDAKDLRVEREIACDDSVLKTFFSRDGRTLVAVVRSSDAATSPPFDLGTGIVLFFDVPSFELIRSIGFRDRRPIVGIVGDHVVVLTTNRFDGATVEQGPTAHRVRIPRGELEPCPWLRYGWHTGLNDMTSGDVIALKGFDAADVYDAELARRLATAKMPTGFEMAVDARDPGLIVTATDGRGIPTRQGSRTFEVRRAPDGALLSKTILDFDGTRIRQLPSTKMQFVVGGGLSVSTDIAVFEVSVSGSK